MDKRIHYLIGLDTETCNGLMPDNLVYDIGWVVTDKRGKIYKVRSFVIREIFCEMKDVMKSAYYAEKIPKYWKDIKAKKRVLANFWTIKKAFMSDFKEYGVKNVFAHNANFDVRALNNTIRYISKSKYRYFFPYSAEIWDTLKMARQTIGKQKTYRRFCERNGYMTNHSVPQVKLTAEILYRYISGEREFVESHTGLEDVLIETRILVQCFRQHKKMEKRLYVPA